MARRVCCLLAGTDAPLDLDLDLGLLFASSVCSLAAVAVLLRAVEFTSRPDLPLSELLSLSLLGAADVVLSVPAR